jgi:hypothetical protein
MRQMQGQRVVDRVRQAFGQYANKCEGINHGAKPMQIQRPKNVIQPIIKLNIQQIYDDMVKLKNSYKIEILN